jgi:transcriptional regulator with XRE-family HTH domain
MDVGPKIRFLREKHGLKQINLANALQVSPQAVSKWEKGANFPDILLIMKIAQLFDVSVDYLLGITEAESGVFEATVLCTSITHFAQRSIVMSSREMADFVNVIFYHLTESALKFDAVPVKYLGDGFLCFFSGPEHPDRALRAAIHAKKAMSQKDLIISINSGTIYLGMIGHPQYAVRDIVGETVNRTFLLMEWVAKNCPSGIGATEHVLKKTRQPFDAILHPAIRVELLHEETNMFEIAIPT